MKFDTSHVAGRTCSGFILPDTNKSRCKAPRSLHPAPISRTLLKAECACQLLHSNVSDGRAPRSHLQKHTLVTSCNKQPASICLLNPEQAREAWPRGSSLVAGRSACTPRISTHTQEAKQLHCIRLSSLLQSVASACLSLAHVCIRTSLAGVSNTSTCKRAQILSPFLMRTVHNELHHAVAES